MKILFIILAIISTNIFAEQRAADDGKIIYNFNFQNQSSAGAPATTTAPATMQPQPVTQPTQAAPLTTPIPSSPLFNIKPGLGIELSAMNSNFVSEYGEYPDFQLATYDFYTIGLIYLSPSKNYFHAGFQSQNIQGEMPYLGSEYLEENGYLGSFEDYTHFQNSFHQDKSIGFYLGVGTLIPIKYALSIDMALDYSLVSNNDLVTISSFKASIGPSFQWWKLNFSIPIYASLNLLHHTSGQDDWEQMGGRKPELSQLQAGFGYNVKYLF